MTDHTSSDSTLMTRVAAVFAAVTLSAATVGAIFFGDRLEEKKSAKAMDESAAVLFKAQGYDVIKRQSYRHFEDKSMADGAEGVYLLRDATSKKAFTASVQCGRAVVDGYALPRVCRVLPPAPKK